MAEKIRGRLIAPHVEIPSGQVASVIDLLSAALDALDQRVSALETDGGGAGEEPPPGEPESPTGGTVHAGDGAPEDAVNSPSAGDWYLDKSSVSVYIYSGTEWELVGHLKFPGE